MKTLRISFDLETLGTRPGCCVLSIGAVVFDGYEAEGVVPHAFYQNVEDPTGAIDLDTVRWWLSQSKAAQERLGKDRVPLRKALSAFSGWCATMTAGRTYETIEFWSRSPSFDEVILKAAYDRAGIPELFPIHRRSSRDCRTLEAIVDLPFTTKTGCTHDALQDSCDQAEHVMLCLKKLSGR